MTESTLDGYHWWQGNNQTWFLRNEEKLSVACCWEGLDSYWWIDIDDTIQSFGTLEDAKKFCEVTVALCGS